MYYKSGVHQHKYALILKIKGGVAQFERNRAERMEKLRKAKLMRAIALVTISAALLFCVGCGKQKNSQVDLNLPTSEVIESDSSSNALSAAEIQEQNTQAAAEVIANVLKISEENAYEIALRFFSIGLSNLETIEKVDSDDGIAAVIVSGDGTEYYIRLDSSGVLQSIQEGGEEGTYIFASETSEEAEKIVVD